MNPIDTDAAVLQEAMPKAATMGQSGLGLGTHFGGPFTGTR